MANDNRSKVAPITGHHTTMQSMAAECVADERADRGFIVWFEADGTMHFGDVRTQRGDICMAAAYIQMLAIKMMEMQDA